MNLAHVLNFRLSKVYLVILEKKKYFVKLNQKSELNKYLEIKNLCLNYFVENDKYVTI